MNIDLNLKGSFVNGQWFKEGKDLAIINPSNKEILYKVQIASKAILDQAIESAKKAQLEWQKVDIKDRAKLILDICEIAEKNLETYAKIDSYNV